MSRNAAWTSSGITLSPVTSILSSNARVLESRIKKRLSTTLIDNIVTLSSSLGAANVDRMTSDISPLLASLSCSEGKPIKLIGIGVSITPNVFCELIASVPIAFGIVGEAVGCTGLGVGEDVGFNCRQVDISVG